MSTLHWIARHWWQVAVLGSAAVVILWCVVLAFGESEERREYRQRQERIARTQAKMRAIRDEYAKREKAKVSSLVDKQADIALAQAADWEEWESAANGKRIA